ncbi:MAG: hypothetical protein QGG40_08725 [Myxococcota bacterium]|jgi:hypothetical protein|nr:hypothetical protein [Myxococcota bacterium]
MRTLFKNLSLMLLFVVHALCAGAALASPGSPAKLVIDNQRSDRVMVYLDGRRAGEVDGRDDRTFAMSEGKHEVRVRGRGGKVLLQKDLVVRQGRTERLRVEADRAKLTIQNYSGTSVVVTIDGSGSVSLGEGQRREFELRTGGHDVRASYTQLGKKRLLEERTVDLRPGERESLTLKKIDKGLVRVVNDTGRRATVRIDNQNRGTLNAGESQEFTTDLGRVRVELRVEQRVVASKSLVVRAYDDLVYRAEAPREGTLVVRNPLPMDVLLVLDDGSERSLKAGGQVTFSHLDPGTFKLLVTREAGERIARLRQEVEAFEISYVSIPSPSQGVVVVDNRGGRSFRVYVDGHYVETVPPHAELRLELELGSRRLTFREHGGAVVETETVQIRRYEESTVDLGQSAFSSSGWSAWFVF